MQVRKVIRLLSWVLLSVLVFGTDALSASFSVVSLNTWGVPYAVKDTFRYAEAMRAIEKISPDFVFLEEVFSAKGKRAYQSDQYPYVVNGPKAFPKLVGSGIRLLSKYPIFRSAKMAYNNCVADDCLSKKGA